MHQLPKNRGFTLIEVAIAAVLMAMVTAWGLYFQAQQVRTQIADSQADRLVTLNNAVNSYESANFQALAAGTSVAGVANAYAPTLTELMNLGLLEPGFNATNLYGGSYTLALSQTPTGCVAPACNISGYVALTSPITDGVGRPDDSLIGEALKRAGGDAAVSTTASPGTVSGLNGTWSMANPVGNRADILAMRNGYASQGFAQFLRRDGTLPMLGNLNMGSNDLTNVNTLNSTNISNAATLTNQGNILNGNNLTTQTLTANSRVTAGEFVALQGTAVNGAACTSNGLLGQDGTGQVLSCQSGVWRGVGSAQVGSTDSGTMVVNYSPYASYNPGTLFYSGGYWSAMPSSWWMGGTFTRPLNPTKNALFVANVYSVLCRRMINQSGHFAQYSVTASVQDNDTGADIGQATTLSPTIHDDCAGAQLPVSVALPKNNYGYTLIINFGWVSDAGPTAYNRSNIYDLQGNVDEDIPFEIRWDSSLFY